MSTVVLSQDPLSLIPEAPAIEQTPELPSALGALSFSDLRNHLTLTSTPIPRNANRIVLLQTAISPPSLSDIHSLPSGPLNLHQISRE